jgi:hypothetical protein
VEVTSGTIRRALLSRESSPCEVPQLGKVLQVSVLELKLGAREFVCCAAHRNNVLRDLTVTPKQRRTVGEDEVSTMHVGTALIAGSGVLLFPGNVFLK